MATNPKRHRWPPKPRGACRNGDRCLDCGTGIDEAKRGPTACPPPDGPRTPPMCARCHQQAAVTGHGSLCITCAALVGRILSELVEPF